MYNNNNGLNEKGNELNKSIILLGNNKVGKTTILNQFVKHHYIKKYIPTIGVDFFNKKFKIQLIKQYLSVSMWDTNGEEINTSILPSKHYTQANAFIIMCSYDNKKSFEMVIEWINFIRKQREKANNQLISRTLPTTIVLINKSDIQKKEFYKEDAMKFIHSFFPTVFISEISIINSNIIQKLFSKIIKVILLKENQELIKSLDFNFQIISIQKNDNSEDNENENRDDFFLCNNSMMINSDNKKKCRKCC